MTPIRTTLIAAASAATLLLGAASAQAGGLKAGQALTVDLGEASGTAYYVREEDGTHVVITLVSPTSQEPMRFEATLADNQSLTVSTPRTSGLAARSLTLVRKGERVVVTAERVAMVSP